MKTFPPGLDTLLAGFPPPVQCDLYTITTVAGIVLRYTTADVDVSYGGNTYSSKNVYFESLQSKSTAHWKVGLDVDTWTVEVMPLATDPISGAAYPAKIGTQPWLAAVRAGTLDGATVQVDRAYWPYWPRMPMYTGDDMLAAADVISGSPWAADWLNGQEVLPQWATITNAADPILAYLVLLNVFLGRVAQVQISRAKAVISINSHLELLQNAMPRNLFQSGCRHTLFDAGCTLAQASFGVACSVLAGGTNNLLNASVPGLPAGSGTFALGQILFTSGANSGLRVGVRSWAFVSGGTTVFTLLNPPPFAPAPGDTFTAFPGCDKSFATCTAFSNQANFGGERWIPAIETAV